jgi:hypothetical protein
MRFCIEKHLGISLTNMPSIPPASIMSGTLIPWVETSYACLWVIKTMVEEKDKALVPGSMKDWLAGSIGLDEKVRRLTLLRMTKKLTDTGCLSNYVTTNDHMFTHSIHLISKRSCAILHFIK